MTTAYKSAIIATFYTAIVVVLIVAKLAGHIHWAWWLVLSPLWGPVAIVVILVIVGIALLGRESAAGRNPFN